MRKGRFHLGLGFITSARLVFDHLIISDVLCLFLHKKSNEWLIFKYLAKSSQLRGHRHFCICCRNWSETIGESRLGRGIQRCGSTSHRPSTKLMYWSRDASSAAAWRTFNTRDSAKSQQLIGKPEAERCVTPERHIASQEKTMARVESWKPRETQRWQLSSMKMVLHHCLLFNHFSSNSSSSRHV